MIRFNINGKDIELEDGFDLSFKYDNQLFAFDNIQLSRSTSFKIPATPNNNILFNFAKRIEQNGDMMRIPIRAAMFYSGGKIDGDIIISDYSDESYNAIFVFGNLLKLKEIKEAGKLKDFLNLTDSVEWSNNTTPIQGGNKPIGFSPGFGIYNYYMDVIPGHKGLYINCLPTVGIFYLIKKCLEYFKIILVDATTDETSYLQSVGIKLGRTNAMLTEDVNFVCFNGNLSTTNLSDNIEVVNTLMDNSYGGFGAQFFRAKEDITISIPEISEHIFIQTPHYEFLGGRSFLYFKDDESLLGEDFIISGQPLANRNILIKKNTLFNFFNIFNYNFNPIFNSWGYIEISDFNYSAVEGLNGEKLDYGEEYYLQPNLPDVTFIDLLKTAAYLINSSFYWDEEHSAIRMFNFDFTNSETIDISGKVISKGKIERKVLEYAQSNLINCKSEDWITTKDKVEKRYYLSNKNVDAEKTLFTFPFSEGLKANYSNNPNGILIYDFKYNQDADQPEDQYELDAKNDIFVQTTTENVSTLQQLQLFSGEDRLQDIIRNGSTMEVRVKMFLFEFLNVRETTVLIIEGKRYATLSASWSKNVATLTLLLIA